jgi:aminoglycoside phosphotransferase (APT) family kinase protein
VGDRIASGRTAEVFDGGPDRVVKVLRPGWDGREGEHEARAARLAHGAGIGAPAVLATGHVDGRFAIAYERRTGIAMVDHLVDRPWDGPALAARFAERHVAMHEADGSTLPDLRDALYDAVERAADLVTARTVATARRRIEGLGGGTAICHGDYHPGNVILTADAPAVIDWVTAAAGQPEADVARTLFLLRDAGLDAGLPWTDRARLTLLRHTFAVAYGRRYRSLRELDARRVRAWRLPILVARLAEGVTAERNGILRAIDRELAVGP